MKKAHTNKTRDLFILWARKNHKAELDRGNSLLIISALICLNWKQLTENTGSFTNLLFSGTIYMPNLSLKLVSFNSPFKTLNHLPPYALEIRRGNMRFGLEEKPNLGFETATVVNTEGVFGTTDSHF